MKKYLIIATIALSALGSLSFVDTYFEISKNLEIFATLFKELNIYYVDETNPGDLMKTGIDAMLQKLDPYTNYITESEIEDYRFMTTGQYGGIGAVIRQRDDYVMIMEPYENFPAQKAGLIPGDLILEVNDKPAKGKTSNEMSKTLKGQAGTPIKLLIRREGETKPIEKTLIREEVKVNDVPYSGMIGDKLGYIKLISFTETATKEVKEAFEKLREKNQLDGIVLDLRGNGGGLLREAVNIVNLFVDKGQEVVNTKGRVSEWDRSHKTLNSPLDTKIPLVILLDRNSASASEIVAGAIQDLDRGVVIGRKSYGKGLVQQTRNLSYNSKLKVTVAKYYIPSGRCIQRIDYSHRNKDGKAEVIPDSLVKAFKTKGGRVIYDGAGIMPDIWVKEPKLSNISYSLGNKLLLFDYANGYRRKHSSIAAARDFQIEDSDYSDFASFIKGKDYSYTTQSEKMLKDMEEVAKKEKYFGDIQQEYDALKKKMEYNKKEDLVKFRDEVKQLLEMEIASRFYYQKGRIENYLTHDPDVKKAIEILGDNKNYFSILANTFKTMKPTEIPKDELEEITVKPEKEEDVDTGEY